MKKILLLILVSTTLCIDLCTEFTTYSTCIATKVDQCRWMPLFSECIRSDNYLMGCDTTLSEKLCVKQVGTVLGEMALCIFDKTCHQIPTSEALKCSDNITRAGCLSVSAEDQHCKWENHQCLQIEDFSNLQNNFMDYELSVSVCPLVTGYLVMHHSLLWPLLEYEPDLIEESDNLILEDEGLFEITEQTYSTGTLQNNYLNEKGEFIWYRYKESKITGSSNLKMNDHTRLGCIALEILSDSDFLNYFSLRGTINGVNHIYCKYLTQHPTDPQMVIFRNNKCVPTTIDEIHDEKFIQSISCQQMSSYICQRLFSRKCVIDGAGEYDCIPFDSKTYVENSNCDSNDGRAISYQCQESEYCFLNLLQSIAFCDPSCYNESNQSSCEFLTQCKWMGDSEQIPWRSENPLKYCVPYNGCNTYGLSKLYCINAAIPCYWNDVKQQCQDSPNLYLVKCNEANTVYTCTSITRYDQYCIWYKDECINIKEQPLLSHFKSLPYVMMNRNACVQMESEYYYYLPIVKECVFTKNIIMKCLDKSLETYKQDLLIENLPCTNIETLHITKYFCLNFISSNTKWDPYNLRCLNMADSQLNKPCDTYTLVNPRICSQSYVPDTHYCFYDDKLFNCYSKKKSEHTMKCTDKGLNKIQCTSITTQGQYCQWSYGKCRSLVYRQILPYKCNSLLQVNGNACAYFTTSVSCLYDPDYTSCAVGYGPEQTCNNNLNPQACQESNAQCYYDYVLYKCLNATDDILNKINCQGSYVSQSTCGKITTPGQQCVWDSGCKKYTEQYTVTCNTFSIANTQVCKYLQSAFVNFFLDGTYCELINGVCTATRELINDCGTDRDINVHRCVAYTNQQCYYDKQYQCLQVENDEYQEILLNTLNCTQSNLNLCGKIKTKGQTCWVIDNNQNVKCSYYSSSKTYTCAELSQLNFSADIKLDSKGKKTWYNRNMCFLATDSCYYDDYQCKQDLTIKLKCDSPGLSRLFCINQTIGNCVFNNRTCEYISDITIACENRNYGACLSGGQNCFWNVDQKMCKTEPDQCPSLYATKYSWLSCGRITNNNCWAYKDQCNSLDILFNLPCEIGLSSSTCQSQQYYCIWQNNRCQLYNKKIHSCSNSLTLNDCMSNYNPDEYCVFANNKCFSVQPNEHKCDEYPQVSINYCYQYPSCVYNKSNNQCLNFLIDQFSQSTQMDKNNYSGVSCQDVATCLLQKSIQCVLEESYWGNGYSCSNFWDVFSQCPYSMEDQENLYYSVSANICLSFSDCRLLISKDLQTGICEQISQPMQCNTLYETYCLKDFPNLYCYFDSECLDIPNDIDCNTIQDMQVSRQSCLLANENSKDSGVQCQFVDDGNNKCKIIITEYTQQCSDINTQEEIEGIIVLCAFTNMDCYIDYDNNVCTDTEPNIGTTYTLNKKLCIQQSGDNYLFNVQTYTCDKIDLNTQLYMCQFLNKDACLNLTNEYSNFQCIWDEDQCRNITYTDYELIDCENRNRNSCFLTYSLECHYNGVCQNALTETTLVSPMVCQKQNKLFDGENCINITNQPKSYYKCVSLDRDQCLNRTSYTYCYWNGTFCQDANLYTLNCTDDVSQQTCLAIINSICMWQDDQCQEILPEQVCETYNGNMNGCSSISKYSCIYDTRFNMCRDVAQSYEACYGGLSLKACREIKNEVCILVQGKCANMQPSFYDCNSIYNKFGCYYIDLSCIWSDELGCQRFEDKLQCNKMPQGVNRHGCINNALPITGIDTCDKCNCSFDDETWLCTFALSGQNIQNFDQLNQNGYEQIMIDGYCNDMKTQLECIGNLKDSCKYINNQCINTDFRGCKNQNKNGCLYVIDEDCSWRDNACFKWNQNKFEIALITKNVCRYLDQSLNVKYDINTQSCIPINYDIDDCNVISVSQITCLSIQNYQCTYINNECKFIQQKNLLKCQDYQNITKQVCQQLQHLSCKFDNKNYQCITIDDNDNCNTLGLSQLGCVNIKTQSCQWINNKCQQFIINNTIDQCDNVSIVNSLSCGLINYQTNLCSYDTLKHVCTSNFNKYSQCTTPGLNYWSCVQLEYESCQFIDNKCQKFINGDYRCFQLQNVNYKVCQQIISDTCAYEFTTKSCYSVLDFVQCNTLGINQNSCSMLNNCIWNYDDIQCQCNQINHKDICYNSNKDTCIQNSNLCTYYQGQCQKKQCQDLQASECNGQIINNLTCYLNQNGYCQSAKLCEDIIYLHTNFKCDQFIFNKSACIQINNYCVSSNNLQQICVNSDCQINSCILEHGICRPLQCMDYNKEDCYLNQNCAYINNKCIQINSCNEIQDPQICRQVIVNNKQCSWEEYRILDTTQICTNTQCELYAPAYTICNGNEINGFTCILVDLIKCLQCEDVTDICTCNNSNNACTWINNQCKSIQCFSFNSELQCNDSKRCYWSQQDKVCRKMCVQNIRQDQCEALIYECHWNPYMRLCEQGVEIIPDLSIDVDVEEEYSQILMILIIIILIIQ